MAVRIKVVGDFKPTIAKINQATKKGQYALVNQVHADSNLYAPKKVSDLRNQSTIALDGKQIIWHVPYAKPQYYNHYKNYTTPNTGPKWDQKAKSIHMREWQRVVRRAMNLR